MIVSKKQFIMNVGEWCWDRDLLGRGYADIYEPVCDTYTKWLTEWVELFNKLQVNDGFKVQLVINCDPDYYTIRRIAPSDIKFPQCDDDEEYTLNDEEEEEAGEVSKESRIDDDSDDDSDDDARCAECGTSTKGRKIRSLWNNVLCEVCGEHSDDDEEEEEAGEVSKESRIDDDSDDD
jgi:hypothetical protein